MTSNENMVTMLAELCRNYEAELPLNVGSLPFNPRILRVHVEKLADGKQIIIFKNRPDSREEWMYAACINAQ